MMTEEQKNHLFKYDLMRPQVVFGEYMEQRLNGEPASLGSYIRANIQQDILDWNLERGNTEFSVETEVVMFQEEIEEEVAAREVGDIHEEVDALCDQYVVYTGTLGKSGLRWEKIAHHEKLGKEFLVKYQQIPALVEQLGYRFESCMAETLKEIDSRVGSVNPETGKWEKDRSPKAQAKWYKADYSRCKL